MSDGGLVSLDFGLAEKAEGDAERAFNTWIETRKSVTKRNVNL